LGAKLRVGQKPLGDELRKNVRITDERFFTGTTIGGIFILAGLIERDQNKEEFISTVK
jgi:hypothetical protein